MQCWSSFCFWRNKCYVLKVSVNIHTNMESEKHIHSLRYVCVCVFYSLRMKTNLQRKRELTPLLIDPAALMDKGVLVIRNYLNTHQRTHAIQDQWQCSSPAAFQ